MAKRNRMGRFIKDTRESLGLNEAQLQERVFRKHRIKIGEQTIRNIEFGMTANPGIKTVEACALGLGLDPLKVISLALRDPPQSKPGYTQSEIAQIWESYSRVRRDKKSTADQLITILREKMDEWREMEGVKL